MKKSLILALIVFFALQIQAQTAKIEVPETYELSNIILALTDYGMTDEWEVQKNTEYYREILKYFEPVKNHPLLDSVNYSREKWEQYLSFRTDAVAFSFDLNGKLKRDYDYFTFLEHNHFDKHLDLIDDFVAKSNFRAFFKDHKDFYELIIYNYERYNYINETICFLETKIGKIQGDENLAYKIILSPLVHRMNLHRNLCEGIVADFPSITSDFINFIIGKKEKGENIEDRLNSNHLIFTEKVHEYINPITNKYIELVNSNFTTEYWDNKSGYENSNSFNEYMTWTIYDLFLEEIFPDNAENISIFWQYQNSERGFFAQNLFSDKVKELYKNNNGENFESIYEPLLQWTQEVEKTITLPTFINVDTKNFVRTDLSNIQIEFSESMNTKLSFNMKILEYKNQKATGNSKLIDVSDFRWSNDGKKINFKIDTEYEEFMLLFNWWEIEKPLISKKGVFLKPASRIRLRK